MDGECTHHLRPKTEIGEASILNAFFKLLIRDLFDVGRVGLVNTRQNESLYNQCEIPMERCVYDDTLAVENRRREIMQRENETNTSRQSVVTTNRTSTEAKSLRARLRLPISQIANMTKVKAYELRSKTKEELQKQLEDLKRELAQLRVQKVASNNQKATNLYEFRIFQIYRQISHILFL